ncbi:MAG: hypothetical protein ACJAV5_001239 [Vicingaceae bacterium]
MVINKSTFISHLIDPNLVGSHSIVGLSEVVQDFPYFQSAQLLLTKAYHSSENLNFESSLKKTAAYAANRQQLHRLLFKPAKPLKNEEVVVKEVIAEQFPPQQFESVEIPEQREEPVKEEYSLIPSPSLDEQAKDFLVIEALPITVTPEANTQPSIDQLTEQNTIDSQSDEQTQEKLEAKSTILEEKKFSIDFSKIEESKKDEYDALENQILSSAVSNSILQNVSDEIPDIDSLNTKRLEKTTIRIVKPVEFKEEISQKLTIDDAADSYTFTDWLKALDDPYPEFEEQDKEEEIEQEYTSNITVFEDDREKVSFYSPVKMARLSVQEDGDLMTETLANIYADQGHLEKSIKAFEKLQLKYPEKSSYFAARIKEIKIQLNT